MPPTLTTLTGLRGLICYRDTLLATLDEDSDENQVLVGKSLLGDAKSDEKLQKFLSSIFQTSWSLVEKSGEPENNSQGDSDSDEEVCFTRPLPVERQEESAVIAIQQVSAAAAELNCTSLDNLYTETNDQIEDPDEEIMRELEAIFEL